MKIKFEFKVKFKREVKLPKINIQNTAAGMTISYYLVMFIEMLSGLL